MNLRTVPEQVNLPKDLINDVLELLVEGWIVRFVFFERVLGDSAE